MRLGHARRDRDGVPDAWLSAVAIAAGEVLVAQREEVARLVDRRLGSAAISRGPGGA